MSKSSKAANQTASSVSLHKDDENVIRLNKSLTLMLPFHCHQLLLKHRLLESLGQVSRFMLEALHDGLSSEDLPVITGLSAVTVNQQLRFLSQHGFVDVIDEDVLDGVAAPVRLSERGLRMVQVDLMLQKPDLSLWLDAFTLHRDTLHVLTNLAATQLLRAPPWKDFHPDAIMPMRQRTYHVFDEMGRLRKLLNADTLPQLLAVFWPEQEAMIRAELDHWEIVLKKPTVAEPGFLPVTLSEEEARFYFDEAHIRTPLPPVWLPVLALKTNYSGAEGLPWFVVLPAAKEHAFEMVGLGALEPALAFHAKDTPPPSGAMALAPSLCGTPATGLAEPLPMGVNAEVTVWSGGLCVHFPSEGLRVPLQRYSDLGLFSTEIESSVKQAAA